MKTVILFFFFLISTWSYASSEFDKGYVLESTIWEQSNIPVCWENYNEILAEQRQWVEEIVEYTWEKESNVRFTGWGACSNDSKGIRILVNDQGPHVKALGNDLDGRVNGMVLNHTFANWSSSCATRLRYCIEVIAVHEFGHALGFAHEQNRPDTDRDLCTNDPQGTNGTVMIGAWDLYSVMNYCNPEWNGMGLLSATDIETVRRYYGTPVSELSKVDVCAVNASSDDGNIPENTLDDDLDTRWSAKGNGQWIEYELCDATEVSQVDIAWYKGDLRSSTFAIETANQGQWSSAYSGASSGLTVAAESYPLNGELADLVRIYGYGNTNNSWNSITEAKLWTGDIEIIDLQTPSNLSIALDSDNAFILSWTDNSTGEDAYIIESNNGYSYGSFVTIGLVNPGVTTYRYPHLRPDTEYTFRVRALKRLSVGNDLTDYAEVSALSPDTNTPLTPISIIASSDDGNIAENVLDNDLDTRWSAKGDGEYIELDLGTLKTVDDVLIAWYKGDQRQANFRVQYSDDLVTWWQVSSSTSSGTTSELESTKGFTYVNFDARYIRIIGGGNSANEWNSITEVQIIGY